MIELVIGLAIGTPFGMFLATSLAETKAAERKALRDVTIQETLDWEMAEALGHWAWGSEEMDYHQPEA